MLCHGAWLVAYGICPVRSRCAQEILSGVDGVWGFAIEARLSWVSLAVKLASGEVLDRDQAHDL